MSRKTIVPLQKITGAKSIIGPLEVVADSYWVAEAFPFVAPGEDFFVAGRVRSWVDCVAGACLPVVVGFFVRPGPAVVAAGLWIFAVVCVCDQLFQDSAS